MINAFKPIKAKLLVIISIIIGLFLVSYIMVYNSRNYTKDIVRQSSQLRDLSVTPELIRLQMHSFLNNEVSSPGLYQTEKSKILDSIAILAKNQISLIDTLKHASYLDRTSRNILSAIQQDLNHFTTGNQALLKVILERGFQQTGLAGDWFRQGEFLENYIAEIKNPVLLKSWINVRKSEYRYNLSHDPKHTEQLTDDAIKLKAALVSSSGDVARSVSAPDKLRIAGEIDKYLELTLKLINKDKAIGLGTNDGLIGNQLLVMNSISLKSKNLSNSVESQTNKHTNTQFFLRLFFLLILTSLILLLFFLSYKNIVNSVRAIISYLQDLVKGRLPEPVTLESRDELGKIAQLLNEFVFSLRE